MLHIHSTAKLSLAGGGGRGQRRGGGDPDEEVYQATGPDDRGGEGTQEEPTCHVFQVLEPEIPLPCKDSVNWSVFLGINMCRLAAFNYSAFSLTFLFPLKFTPFNATL